jgi:hypothetical protein
MTNVRKCKSNTVLSSVDVLSYESEFFPNGRGDLRAIAKKLNVSAPTARKILAIAYPGRIVFRRGRRGGTHLLPVGANVSPEVAAAEPDRAPRKRRISNSTNESRNSDSTEMATEVATEVSSEAVACVV